MRHHLVLVSLGHLKKRNTTGDILKNVQTVPFQTMKAAVTGICQGQKAP